MASKDSIIHKYKSHPVIRKRALTKGQIWADRLTIFAGSWKFIIGLLVFIAIWMVFNIITLKTKGLDSTWDPYPFILLNFVLSCLAALQAPIILMSQNREAERDRINARYDYLVNRKAEREINNMQKDLDEIKDMIKKMCK